jgi:hypothetical protein
LRAGWSHVMVPGAMALVEGPAAISPRPQLHLVTHYHCHNQPAMPYQGHQQLHPPNQQLSVLHLLHNRPLRQPHMCL